MLFLVCALGLRAQTVSDHLIKAQGHQIGGMGFTVGGAALYFIANDRVKFADPGTVGNYKILRAFSVGCVGLGLYLETVAIVKIRKARMLITPTGTGLNLSYRF